MSFFDYLCGISDREYSVMTEADKNYRKKVFRLLDKFYVLDKQDAEELEKLTEKYCW